MAQQMANWVNANVQDPYRFAIMYDDDSFQAWIDFLRGVMETEAGGPLASPSTRFNGLTPAQKRFYATVFYHNEDPDYQPPPYPDADYDPDQQRPANPTPELNIGGRVRKVPIQKQLKLITDRHDKYRSTMRPRLDKERDRLQIRRQKIDDYIKRTEVRKQEIKNMIVIRTDAYNSAVARYKQKEQKFAEKIKQFEEKISKLKKESPARGLLEKALFFALKIEYAFMNYPKTSKKLTKTLNEYKNDYRDAVMSLRDLLKINTDSYESRLAEKYSNQIPEDIVKSFIHPDLSESEQIKAIQKDYNDFIEDVQVNIDEFQK